jgi:hypothetical protein
MNSLNASQAADAFMQLGPRYARVDAINARDNILHSMMYLTNHAMTPNDP